MTTQAPEIKIVDTFRVACDGGEGALGHPRVWLQISSKEGWVECPYCCLLYTSPSPRDKRQSSMPSSA
mgnify:CR=1 FL=1